METMVIYLMPYADHTPEVMHWNTPLARTFRHFHAAGLRHLCLVDEGHRLVGMLTRSDLAPLCQRWTRERFARSLLMRKRGALLEVDDEETDGWGMTRQDSESTLLSDDY